MYVQVYIIKLVNEFDHLTYVDAPIGFFTSDQLDELDAALVQHNLWIAQNQVGFSVAISAMALGFIGYLSEMLSHRVALAFGCIGRGVVLARSQYKQWCADSYPNRKTELPADQDERKAFEEGVVYGRGMTSYFKTCRSKENILHPIAFTAGQKRGEELYWEGEIKTRRAKRQ